MLQDLDQVLFGAEVEDRARIGALLENAQDRLAGARVHLLHDRRQFLLRARQIDALRAAESGGDRLLRFLDDARAQRRIGETLQHLRAAAVLLPSPE